MAMYNYTPNTNYYGANEEERRRREQEQLAADDAARLAKLQMPAPPVVEQAGVPVAPVAPEPIKQTITYDPVSGEQRMKIEGNARDLSAENPLTPTLTMPGSVSPEQIDQQQQMEMAAQQREREAQMAQQAQAQAQAQQPMPQPGPGVQVASVAPGLPQTQPAQPYTGPGQGEEAQTVGQAQLAPQQPPAPPATDPMAMFTAAVGDTAKLLQIYNDKNQPPELRRMAGREASRQLKAETEQVEAENKVKTMTPNEVQRELRKSDEEGSWTKRVIFGLLNMQGAMAAEDAKLGIGAKFQSINLNGQPVEIKVRADGKAMEGYNAQTLEPLSKKELVAATAQMTTLKGAEQGAQVYMDPSGTVKGTYVLERRPGQTPVYKEIGSGRIASGTESAALRQTGVQGTLADQSSRQLQELQNKLAFVGPTASIAEREKIIGESESTWGALPEAYKAQIRGGAPRPNVAAAPNVAAQAQPADQAQPQAQPAGQTQTQRAPAPVTAQAAPGGGVRLSVVPGGDTPGARASRQRIGEAAATAQIQGAKEVSVAEQKVPAEARGKLQAKDINNQGYADSTYGLIKPISDSIRQSTGSSIGAGADKLAGVVGVGTEGAANIARLEVLGYQLLSNVPRFEGPQSDIDVQMYKQAAGDLANSSKPVNVRLAALDSIVMMLKKYDKAGNNDWTFAQPGGNIKIIKREKVQ